MHRRKRRQLILILFLSLFALLSCAPSYFDPIKTPVEPPRVKGLNDLPYRELWAGIVFNGEKVGFTHLKIVPLTGEGLFRLESEAHLRIRFLGLSKRISMKSVDMSGPISHRNPSGTRSRWTTRPSSSKGRSRTASCARNRNRARNADDGDEAQSPPLPDGGDQSIPRPEGACRRYKIRLRRLRPADPVRHGRIAEQSPPLRGAAHLASSPPGRSRPP